MKKADALAFRWTLICSVANDECIPALREFALWLTSALQRKAVQYGCRFHFDQEPKAMMTIRPGDEEGLRSAYGTIHTDYPDVIVVFHILPAPNSVEYKIMKQLADKYDLIRQGVLLENALTRFANCDLNAVLGNIIQWFNRRIALFVSAPDKSSAKFSLHISDEGKKGTNATSFIMSNVSAAVHKVLHNKEDETSHSAIAKSVVRVSGYPNTFNEFDISKIFGNFRVVRVTKNMKSGAMVQFVNAIHAAQAAIEYDKKWIDSEHLLAVIPTHPDVLQQVELALDGEEGATNGSLPPALVQQTSSPC